MNTRGSKYPLIYISAEETVGSLLSYGAYASRVAYEIDGIEIETTMLNEEFTIIREIDFGI